MQRDGHEEQQPNNRVLTRAPFPGRQEHVMLLLSSWRQATLLYTEAQEECEKPQITGTQQCGRLWRSGLFCVMGCTSLKLSAVLGFH
jgi:hypothetical protein